MLVGDSRHERIALNHEWLWRGQNRKKEHHASPDQLAEVRRLLLAEQWEDAATLANYALGGGIQPGKVDAYCPAGDLHIESNHSFPSGYRRELNLANAQATVQFKADIGRQCRRDVIAHLVEDRILVRLTHEADNPPDVAIWLDRMFEPDCTVRRKACLRPATGRRLQGRIRFRVQAAL